MNQTKFIKALTEGLLAGYGGKTIFTSVKRSSFELKSSHYEADGIVYHDEWTSGGGQEIVSVDGVQFTRVYAGGAIGETKEVVGKLMYFIQQLKDKTRLFINCEMSDGDWHYRYQIIDTNLSPEVTVGKETITHQNQIVFIHVFVLSPITE